MKTNERKAVGHTAGEWKVCASEGRHAPLEVIGPDQELIARVVYQNAYGAREVNATLIAQAPAMLEALENLANSFKAKYEDYDTHPGYIQARAIIARAKGVQP